MPITFLEVGLALTHKRPSYRPTGAHPSPRSASVWRLVISSGSLSSTGTPTHCSHWSLMGNTAPPHWVVTRGSGWLVHGPPCSATAIRKDSMQWETLVIPKQESASLLTRRITVVPVTPESVLAQEVSLMIPTLVEIRQRTRQIMETSTSKPWGISWYSNRGHSPTSQILSREAIMKKKMSCPNTLKANKAMSLTLYSSLVSFVSNIIFFNEIQGFHLCKANSGFVDEVNIGKEAIFDVYDTSTSLSVSESWECNTEKKKHRKCDFLLGFFVFLLLVLFFTLTSRIFLL